MCLFVEAIKLKDGALYRLKYHQKRVNTAFEKFFPNETTINLFDELNQILLPQSGIYKCRIVYNDSVQSIEFTPYLMREIKTLKLVETEIETLVYKLEDRRAYNIAYEKRSDCDDVLMVKNGFITDTSYSNVALFDGKNWHTPRTPLLYGTNRAELLEKGIIVEKDIKVSDLKNYQRIAIFNAMIEFGELVLDIKNIL